VSGALVLGSFERTSNLPRYGEKRFRRLYPAYFVVVLLPALVSLILAGPDALRSIGAYLAANLVFLNFLAPDLPGLFAGHRFEEVNGALWTLKIEVMFYLVLPILGLIMRGLKSAWWLLLVALYVGGEIWRLQLAVILTAFDVPPVVSTYAPELARQLPGQMAFFASGMMLWRLWPAVKVRWMLCGLTGAGLLTLSLLVPMFEPLRAAGLALVIACAAFAPGPKLNAARYGDISYGLYITHFPIMQGAIMTGLIASLGLAAGFAAVLILVIASSFVLWWAIEKPALRRDSHYRQVALGS
jgi:peptidoglycan/LPS O-acetylase OafA/YrhL